MNKLNLSPETRRRRLWPGYSILLKLAEETEKDTLKETELCEAKEATVDTEKRALTQLDSNTAKVQLKEGELDKLAP